MKPETIPCKGFTWVKKPDSATYGLAPNDAVAKDEAFNLVGKAEPGQNKAAYKVTLFPAFTGTGDYHIIWIPYQHANIDECLTTALVTMIRTYAKETVPEAMGDLMIM